jgi:hypothetical protein
MVGVVATLAEVSTKEETMLDPAIAARLKRDASGLVAAIAQQYDTGEVLMLGWMDDEALHRTLTTGQGRPGRRRVPHRRPDLFRRRRARGGDRGGGPGGALRCR